MKLNTPQKVKLSRLNHDELFEKSKELDKLKTWLDEKEFRWLELSELM